MSRQEYQARWARENRARDPEEARRKKREYDARPENRERARELGRARYARDPAAGARKQRDWRRKSMYGITPEQYSEMLVEQDGLCAICYVESAILPDHDHETGRVRGLLCFSCNIALGHFKDDPDRMAAAIDYLEAAA